VTNEKTIPYCWECIRCKTKGVVEGPERGDIYPTVRDAHNKVSPNCRAWDEFVNGQGQRSRKT